jgi:DNA-directed RNA polymerase specialized sigma24 family protein
MECKMSELNPYNEIWPLRHNAEVWGHPESSLAQQERYQEQQRDLWSAAPTRHSPLKYHGKDEILAALHDLSKDEMNRLTMLARCMVRNTARGGYVEAEDLFMDATVRTLRQTRRWKRSVSRFDHLLGVMRSIAHQRLKQSSRYVTLNELIAAPQGWNVSALDAHSIVVRLKDQLSGDAVALSVLESMADKMRPRNAQRSLGISTKVYWAARKRIRRRAEDLPGTAHFCGSDQHKSRSRRNNRTSRSERMSTP